MVNDDVYRYFYGDYADGDSRKTPTRRIVARSLERMRITSMSELCALSELEILRVRGIGASRRAVLLEVLEQYRQDLQKPYRILMIDGNAAVREESRTALAGRGYEVLEAASLAEGRSLLEQEKPDLLMLEGVLPDGSGFDFCRELRGSSTIPVLFYCALHGAEDIVAGLSAGGDDYLEKPGDPEVLAARVEALIRRFCKESDGWERAAAMEPHPIPALVSNA